MYRTYAALLGTAALAMAGCGGGDDASSSGDTPPTKQQFIAQTEAICRDVKQAQQPYSDQIEALPKGTDLKRVAPILERALAESRKGLERLRALPAPVEDKAVLEEYYSAAERLLDAHADLADAARTSNRAAGRKVAERSNALSREQEQLAGDYGFKACDTVF